MKITKSITERVEEFRAEMNAFIDKRAAALAKQFPGVPEAMHRRTITRGMGCACAGALLVAEEIAKETAA